MRREVRAEVGRSSGIAGILAGPMANLARVTLKEASVDELTLVEHLDEVDGGHPLTR